MNEHPIFESIRNHQVEAPERIMNKAIVAAKRKSFLAFHWHTFNAWYLGLLMLASGFLLLNPHESAQQNRSSIESPSIPTTPMVQAPVVTSMANSSTSQEAKVSTQRLKRMEKKQSRVISQDIPASEMTAVSSASSTDKLAQPIAEEKVTASVQEVSFENVEPADVVIKDKEKSSEKNAKQVKQSKKKCLPVKWVKP